MVGSRQEEEAIIAKDNRKISNRLGLDAHGVTNLIHGGAIDIQTYLDGMDYFKFMK